MPPTNDPSETIFEYLYRDAGNFKSWGALRLHGTFSPAEISELIECMEAGEFFIAEQVGVPPLYDGLFKWSGGRTRCDHAWHAFHCLRASAPGEQSDAFWGSTSDLMRAFGKAKGRWMPELSPNFG